MNIYKVFIHFPSLGKNLIKLGETRVVAITVLVRSELRKGIRFFDKESSEQFLWWKLGNCFFDMKQDLFVCTVYIPPQNSSRERRLDCDHFESLQEDIYKFSKLGSIVLCDDFNARMSNLDDYIVTLRL